MRKNIYSFLVLSTIFILTLNIFFKSDHLTDIIVFSVNLFIKNIFPSLFPMFIISYVLVQMKAPEFLGSVFNKLFSKFFGCTGISSFVFFMSMLTGFPSSAKYVNDLIDSKTINESEAQKILNFTFFSNPLFIVNTVGCIFLQSKKIGVYIFISHVIGNIITGLFFRNYNNSSVSSLNSFSFTSFGDVNIFRVLLNGIRSSLEILLNTFGIVTFFLILINTIFTCFDSFFSILVAGVMEMTTGLKYLSISNLPFTIKILLSSFFISFGGLSIHAQIMNILKEKKVKYLPFLLSRIVHGLISIIVVFIIFSIDMLF